MTGQTPIPGARYIPELRLSTQFQPKLDQYEEFTLDSWKDFRLLSGNDRQKSVLQLPMPAIINHIHSSRFNTPKSDQSGANLATEDLNHRIIGGSFTIDDREFTYEYSSYQYVNQFLTPIWKNNQLSEDDFFSDYVQPYLDRRVNYERLYSKRSDEIVRFLNTFQYSEESTSTVILVERALARLLYDPLEKPLLKSLKKFQSGARTGLSDYLGKKKAEIDPPLNNRTPLKPYFDTTHAGDFRMLGISMLPKGCLGYCFEEDHDMLATLVGIIEVKTPSFAMLECYQNLCGIVPGSGIQFDDLGISSLGGDTLKFMKTVRKYSTMCLHVGCDRFLLVDYESYLFVHLGESVSSHPEDQKGESKKKKAEQLIRENRGEGSSHQMAVASTVGTSRRKRSNAQTSETPKAKESDNDNTSTQKLSIISSRHFCVSRKHPNVRLFVLAFLGMNKTRWLQIRKFRGNVIALMTTKKEQIEQEEKVKHHTSQSSQNSAAKRQKTGRQGTRGTSSVTLSSPRDYKFEKGIFDVEYKIDFDPIRHKLLRVASNMHSQVISIYSKKFMDKLYPSHLIFGKDFPDISLLKIFDPLWKEDLEELLREDVDVYCTYPDAIAMCTDELKVYERLKSLMGICVPSIYSYGRICDINVGSGQWKPRFWGGFIQMEYIESDREFTKNISTDFVLEPIIPVYKRLHKCGVIQNDFKLSNFIITKDHHEVKIIDFSEAIITNDEKLFEKEIKDIKRYFKIPFDVVEF